MEVMCGYKQTEVGVIPQNWESSTLGAFAFVTKLAGFEYTLYFDYSQSGPIIAIRALNIKNGTLDLRDVHTIPKTTSDLLPRSKLVKGDLVISYVGTLGRVAVIPDNDKFHLAPNVAKISVDTQHVDSGFLAQYLNSFRGQKLIFAAAASTTQAALSMGNLREIFFARPPLPEQRAIAAALSDVDALLDGLKRLIAKKRDLKQAAMQQLLTGQTRLSGFYGELKRASLSAICGMKSGEGITSAEINDSSTYPCYGGNGLRGYTARFTHDGCFALIGRQGALCGNVVRVEGKFFASEHAVVVTPYSHTDIRWLTYVLARMNLNQYSESSAQPGLSVSKILILHLYVPPSKDEQTAIAAILADMEAELAALEVRRDKTRALKQAMMQELLNGRTRLI